MPPELTRWAIVRGKVVLVPLRPQPPPGLAADMRAYRLRKRRAGLREET